MPKFTYQVLMEAGEGEWGWYFPPGDRPEFDDATSVFRSAIQKYPGHDIRVTLVCPHGRGYTPKEFTDFRPSEPHKVMRPLGSVRGAIWSMFRGVSDARAWRSKCSRCGKTGQAHWSKRSILTCRRFQP